jgi:hypothetical protein
MGNEDPDQQRIRGGSGWRDAHGTHWSAAFGDGNRTATLQSEHAGYVTHVALAFRLRQYGPPVTGWPASMKRHAVLEAVPESLRTKHGWSDKAENVGTPHPCQSGSGQGYN